MSNTPLMPDNLPQPEPSRYDPSQQDEQKALNKTLKCIFLASTLEQRSIAILWALEKTNRSHDEIVSYASKILGDPAIPTSSV